MLEGAKKSWKFKIVQNLYFLLKVAKKFWKLLFISVNRHSIKDIGFEKGSTANNSV